MNRIARWLTGIMSAQRAATAAPKIATRGEMRGIRLVHRAPELGRQRGNLDRSPFAEGITPAL